MSEFYDARLGISTTPPSRRRRAVQDGVSESIRRRRRADKQLRNIIGLPSGSPDERRMDRMNSRMDASFIREDEGRAASPEESRSGFGSSSGTMLERSVAVSTVNYLYSRSNMLPQLVDAMKTNIAGYGSKVVAFAEGVEIDPVEEATLKSWLEHADTDNSFSQIEQKQIFDFEKHGARALEVVRNRAGKATMLKHVSSSSLQMTSRQRKTVEVVREIERGGERSRVRERRRFRKFVQRTANQIVWFKEFGDPRTMDWRTGNYQSRETGRISEKYKATEILWRTQEGDDPYGMPRWIHLAPTIMGSRESEEVNLRYFEDNTVPPSIITVSNGRLTRASFEELKNVIESGGRGRQNKMMLLEAISEGQGLDDGGVAQLRIEKMSDQRPSDGLFRTYDEQNRAKLRSAFRLPPIITGESQDVTFATANVSAFLAEMQVFLPNRAAHNDWLNNAFVNHEAGLNLKTVKIESKGPKLTDPAEVVKALREANSMGALTPRKAVDLINQQMQVRIAQYPKMGAEGWEEWMDRPLSLSLRRTDANDREMQDGSPGGADPEKDGPRDRAGEPSRDQTAQIVSTR